MISRVLFALINKQEKNLSSLTEQVYEEQKMVSLYQQDRDQTAIFYLYFYKLNLAYLFEEYDRAIDYAAYALDNIDGVLGQFIVAKFYFYDSLIKLELYSQNPQKYKYLLKKVNSNQKQMKQWADNAPMNYQHKYYLVEAEKNRVLGKKWQAAELYDRAENLAAKNDYIHEQALANELAAKFYLAEGKEKIARTYMKEAKYLYKKWGAKAKAKDLQEKYPQLLSINKEAKNNTDLGTVTTEESEIIKLDFDSLLKLNQVISSELNLNKLLEKIVKIVIENAGAQQGYLILERDGKWAIEAEGAVNSQPVNILKSLPIDSLNPDKKTPLLPVTIVNYAIRTSENVVLNDASNEGQFISDRYIIATKPKSILCTPLFDRKSLVGIVYLENNLTTGAFSKDRLTVLKILAYIIAVSIQNARYLSERQLCYINQKAGELLGKGLVRETDIDRLAEIYRVYLPQSDRLYPPKQWQVLRLLQQGGTSSRDDWEIHRDGKIIPIESWGSPIFDERGKITYAVTAFTDITERKEAEAEVTFFLLMVRS